MNTNINNQSPAELVTPPKRKHRTFRSKERELPAALNELNIGALL